MKSYRSWRIEWAIGGLLLLPFSIAKRPQSFSSLRAGEHGSPSARRRGVVVAERTDGSDYTSRRTWTRNASTSLADDSSFWRRREYGTASSFIKRSRFAEENDDEPSLPSYPPIQNDKYRQRRDPSFSRTQPHVTEPESDVDAIWSRYPPSSSSSSNNQSDPETEEEPNEEELAHSPVVYQYFGRSRSRVHTADSIPFILLGPTVDHWKTVGQILASRGFSVMACEIVDESRNAAALQDEKQQGKNLILAVLDALRWNRAILVGCDSEAATAIEAAIQLAPDRVKGLVLCGDLASADQLARRAIRSSSVDNVDRLIMSQKVQQEDRKRHVALDSLLSTYLACPYTLIWDGDIEQAPQSDVSGNSLPFNMNSGDMFRYSRCLILGGGTAPHRRRPEQFAWALTRFVEEKVAPRSVPIQSHSSADNGSHPGASRGLWGSFTIPHFVETIFSQGSLLITGRVVANLIYILVAWQVATYQYRSFQGGVVSINSLVRYASSWRQRVLQSTGSFIRNYGYIFTLFGRRRRPSEVKGDSCDEQSDGEGEASKDSEESPSEGSNDTIQGQDVDASEDSPSPGGEESEETANEGENTELEVPESHENQPKTDGHPQRLMLLDQVVV